MIKFTGEEFEEEVRRISRILFSNSIGQGSEKIDGRERDGVFWNGNFYTIVEATLEKKKDKAESDAKKTNELVIKRRTEGNMAQGFVVTLSEPTADQKLAVKKYERTTKIISFDELRSKLINAHEYLRNRSARPFGSIYDHVKYNYDVPRSDFVFPTIVDYDGIVISEELFFEEYKSKKAVILADYGVGKSMLLREVFFRLYEAFSQGKNFRFPVYINLRDHSGQDDPVELLERHARHNGVEPRSLVGAWIAGYIDLIIDGFDEFATRGWTGDHRKLREFRRSTHAVIRKLIKDTPSRSLIIVSGREAYFDSEAEMRDVIGAPLGKFIKLRVQHFDEAQIKRFLLKKGLGNDIPAWVPARPLFLNYLIGKRLISDVAAIAPFGPFPEGSAWRSLIEMVAERESEQVEGLDKGALLSFLALLATRSRQSSSLDRSFSPNEIDQTFFEATGNAVSEDERRLLLRLPGLGVSPDSGTGRMFIDHDFLQASGAYAVEKFIENPHGINPSVDDLRRVRVQLSHIGKHVVASSLSRTGINFGRIKSALDSEIKSGSFPLAYDVFSVSTYIDELVGTYTFHGIEIDEFDLCQDIYDGLDIILQSCIIDRLILPTVGDARPGVRFVDCMVGRVEGRSSENQLPKDQFVDCAISEFGENFSVNSSILGSSLALGVGILVVSLRKIFAQSGLSRLESALLRGLDQRAKMIAPEVIRLMLKYNFIQETGRRGKIIYVGMRDMRGVALSIIGDPMSNVHPILKECRNIT